MAISDQVYCLQMLNRKLDMESFIKLLDKIDSLEVSDDSLSNYSGINYSGINLLKSTKKEFTNKFLENLTVESEKYIKESPKLCKSIKKLKTFSDYVNLFNICRQYNNTNQDWIFEYYHECDLILSVSEGIIKNELNSIQKYINKIDPNYPIYF